MPDEDAARVANIAKIAATVGTAADTVRTIAEKVIAAGATFNETRDRLDTLSASLSRDSHRVSAMVNQFAETVRGGPHVAPGPPAG